MRRDVSAGTEAGFRGGETQRQATKLRVTFVLPALPIAPSGGYRVVYAYANGLAARGHEVSVVHPRRAPSDSFPRPDRWRARVRDAVVGLRVRAGWTPAVDWQAVDARVRMLFVADLSARHIPDGDAVFATWWRTAEVVAGLGAEKGAKWYLVQHHETFGGPAERVNATWRLPLRKLVIGSWLRDVGQSLGVAADELQIVHNGLDHDRFRVRRDVAARPKRVAMLASSAAFKGMPDGLAALAQARARHADLRAVLFGVAPRPKDLPSWIEYRERPAPDVLVDDVYNGSGIFICPSLLEGWHLPSVEAAACGCALVTTDCGGNRDYAVHEQTALVSPPGQPGELGANLIRLLDDDALRVRLAAAANRRVRDFTWERSTARLEAALFGAAVQGA